MPRLDVYWSFRSPYSYLATDRLAAIRERYAVEFRFRPVRPLAMREPDFFERNRPQFLPYLLRDVVREAERLGISFAPPRPDPIRMDMATGKVAAEQPIMTPLMALGVAAADLGRGLEFAGAVAAGIWGGLENWNAPENLAAAARAAGLGLAELEAHAQAQAELLAKALAESEAEQLKHHWGVPLMVLDDEPFFGQDRIDALRWRLDRMNLGKAG
jgi:2-hydroxychromene-2-carboxylate isomerase